MTIRAVTQENWAPNGRLSFCLVDEMVFDENPSVRLERVALGHPWPLRHSYILYSARRRPLTRIPALRGTDTSLCGASRENAQEPLASERPLEGEPPEIVDGGE